jgi:glutathione S-transferase
MPARRGPPATAAERAAPLTLYDHPLSPHGRRIRILLREKGLAWTTVTVDLLAGAHKAPEYLAVNPNGELPALRHGARVVVDTPAIAEYLERVFPAVPLSPDRAWPLAEVRMWLALEAGTHKEFRPLWWLCVAKTAPRFDTSPDLARHIIGQKIAVLERRLARHDYLVGDALSVADIAWFTRIDLLPQLGVEVTLPGVRRWAQRLAARPAFAAA